MGSGVYGNAMTEVALALAMAFFALMVLTLMSMGSDPAAAGLSLPAGVTARGESAQPKGPAPVEAVSAERLVIFYADSYFDSALRPLDPGAGPADSGQRTVLALPPELSLSQALVASRRLGRPDPIVTTLDAAWMARLREMSR